MSKNQDKEVQDKEVQDKEVIDTVSKVGLGIAIAFITGSAIVGAISGIAVNAIIASYFPNLSLMIKGGMIGLGFSPLQFIFIGPFAILSSAIQFGIGVGLTSLGLTSPAAIGALSAGLTTAIPFILMLTGINIMSRFISQEESPSSKLDEGITTQSSSSFGLNT